MDGLRTDHDEEATWREVELEHAIDHLREADVVDDIRCEDQLKRLKQHRRHLRIARGTADGRPSQPRPRPCCAMPERTRISMPLLMCAESSKVIFDHWI